MAFDVRSRMADPDDEQSGAIGAADDFFTIEHDRGIGFNRDAAQPGLGRHHYGSWPNRRPIGAAFLPRLLHLYQHAARPLAAERSAATHEFIGALDRLYAEHKTLLNDHGLTDIEGADRSNDA